MGQHSVVRKRRYVDDRFWEKVAGGWRGCWLWQGAKTRGGYGVFDIDGAQTTAHRVAWLLIEGPIPDGLWVLHSCDNPPCVRPDHLFLGTAADNHSDAMSKGRLPAGERHYMAKLSDHQVAEIRRRLAAGEKALSIARSTGISPGYVRLLKGGRRRRVTTEEAK